MIKFFKKIYKQKLKLFLEKIKYAQFAAKSAGNLHIYVVICYTFQESFITLK